jgi:hypothetical protein
VPAQTLVPRTRIRHRLALASILAAAALAGGQVAVAAPPTVVDGTDVKVTIDNNNVDGGTPNPSFDAQNRQANETTIAINPVDPDIVAAGANDYRMVSVHGDGWLGFYVSADGGDSWFNTMVPGFTTDTSANGMSSPLRGLDASGDPVVRFDAAGNLYVGGIAFNRDFDQADKSLDTVAYLAKYWYTPGTPAGTSTPNAAGDPPNYTYAFTTVVDKGAVGFANPGAFGFGGQLDDKNWHDIDRNPSSPCFGNVYYTYTKFAGQAGGFPIVFSRSLDGGATFDEPQQITNVGRNGTHATQGSYLAIASDGTIFIGYRTFPTSSDPTTKLQVVKSTNCGKSFGQPVTAATLTPMPRQTTGLSFRTPLEVQIAVSDVDPNRVYATYMAMNGDNADIYVVRSTNGARSFGAPVVVNDDGTHKHQFWPTIAVSNGLLSVGWYDLRQSDDPILPDSGNHELDVFYAHSSDGLTFSDNHRVTDVSHDPNCMMFGGGTVGFHGDYIELAARWDGDEHVVHIVWADNRDVSPCDLDPAPGPATNNIGNRNQNIYGDTLIVDP